VIDLNLTKDEFQEYVDALRDNHRVRIQFDLLDQNEDHIDSLSTPINRVVSGSVQVDLTADVTRSLEVTVLDENRRLRFEGNSPARGAVYADRFIAVRYDVYVKSLDDWVSCPVFWGPLTGYSREGNQVTLEAQGKEILLMAPHYATNGYTLKKNQRLDDAIKEVALRAGETRFDIPEFSDAKLRTGRVVVARDEPWMVLKGGDQDANGDPVPGLVGEAPGERMIYYDARGRLTVRGIDQAAVVTFADGRDLVTHPSVSYDLTEFRNTVVVRGKKPEGKPHAIGKAQLKTNHPLSSWNLRRNGIPRYMTEFVEAEGLKTVEECEARAELILEKLAQQGVTPSFECLPLPYLEEADEARLETDEWSFKFALKQFTLPLTVTEPMTIGTNVMVSRFRKRKQRKKGTGLSNHHGLPIR
jgi:hypothetical protein